MGVRSGACSLFLLPCLSGAALVNWLGRSHPYPLSSSNQVQEASALLVGTSEIISIGPTAFIIKLWVDFNNPICGPSPSTFWRQKEAFLCDLVLSSFVTPYGSFVREHSVSEAHTHPHSLILIYFKFLYSLWAGVLGDLLDHVHSVRSVISIAILVEH